MKLLALLAFIPAINALTESRLVPEFASPSEILKCVQKCQDVILPCINEKEGCYKVYQKCMESKTPHNCAKSAPGAKITAVATCQDQRYTMSSIIDALSIEVY